MGAGFFSEPAASLGYPRGMRVGLVGLLASFALVGGVRAQAPVEALPVSEEDDRRARIHFESGRQYFDEGEYERAVDEFTRAFELSHRPPLLMNIANAQERLGRYTEAADLMQQYHDQAEETVPTRDVLARRIANLRARADRVATGQPDPDPLEPDVTHPDTVEPEASGGGRTLGAVISFGLAGVGLVTAGVLGGLALAERNSVADGCGTTRSCTSSDVSKMDGLALGADIGLALAVAGAVAGVLVLVLVDGDDASDAQASVTPWLGREAAGAVLRGSF